MDKEEKIVAPSEEVTHDGVRKGRRTSSRESNRRLADDSARQREQSEWEEKIIQYVGSPK